jgi:hypothetical protein
MGEEFPFVFRLGPSDEVVFVNEGWLALLRETGVPDVVESEVRGRQFRQFLPDPGMAELYELTFRRVRKTGQSIRFPHTFDSPSERRHMEMEVLPLEGGSLECRTRTVLVESRAAPGKAGSSMPKQVLTLCAWCKKVRLPDGTWVEVESAAERLEFFLLRAPDLSHGICPSCKADMLGGFALLAFSLRRR